jgi:hypothetical protein
VTTPYIATARVVGRVSVLKRVVGCDTTAGAVLLLDHVRRADGGDDSNQEEYLL